MHETGVDENDGEDWADYDYDEMVPMVIVMSVVGMVLLKSVQLKTTPRKRKGFGPWLLC